MGNVSTGNSQAGMVYGINGLFPAVCAGTHGYANGNIYDDRNNIELPAVLKYQRTEYAKKIRKDYEAGRIKERRCNMRECTLRDDGLCNTITTVQKDNYIVVGAAMRGRYNSDGKIEQQIEVRDDEVSNAITTAQKDSLVVKYEE
jgi:hypothetical protein